MPTSGPSDETSPREFRSLILDYHPEASLELIEAARFYEERGADLGHRFLDAHHFIRQCAWNYGIVFIEYNW